MKYLVAGFIGKAKDFCIDNLVVKGTVKMQEEESEE